MENSKTLAEKVNSLDQDLKELMLINLIERKINQLDEETNEEECEKIKYQIEQMKLMLGDRFFIEEMLKELEEKTNYIENFSKLDKEKKYKVIATIKKIFEECTDNEANRYKEMLSKQFNIPKKEFICIEEILKNTSHFFY